MPNKKGRTCSKCGGFNHDARNCQKKTDDSSKLKKSTKTNKRKCGYCGRRDGHNIQTCPDKMRDIRKERGDLKDSSSQISARRCGPSVSDRKPKKKGYRINQTYDEFITTEFGVNFKTSYEEIVSECDYFVEMPILQLYDRFVHNEVLLKLIVNISFWTYSYLTHYLACREDMTKKEIVTLYRPYKRILSYMIKKKAL